MRAGTSTSGRPGRGAAAAALRLGALALLLAAAAPALAQESEREVVLPGSGIRYPMGYEPETEGAVEGRVTRVDVPERGPVVLTLEVGGRPVTVLAGPSWYWERTEGRPAAGERVRVVGSRSVGADGELYYVAREIHGPARCGCALRDEQGRPLWRGRMREAPPRRCAPPAAAAPAARGILHFPYQNAGPSVDKRGGGADNELPMSSRREHGGRTR